jgi:hypothetical protein
MMYDKKKNIGHEYEEIEQVTRISKEAPDATHPAV